MNVGGSLEVLLCCVFCSLNASLETSWVCKTDRSEGRCGCQTPLLNEENKLEDIADYTFSVNLELREPSCDG